MRYHRARLALAAALAALLAAIVATASPTAVVFPVVDAIAVSGGLASVLLALSKRDVQWSRDKRSAAVAVAVVWLVAAVLAFPISFAYAACVPCADDNTPRIVVTVAAFAGPLLLFLAATLPGRRAAP